LSLPQILQAKANGNVNPGSEDKAYIMMFNLGGASQPDLWDMKPDAPARSAQFLISS